MLTAREALKNESVFLTKYLASMDKQLFLVEECKAWSAGTQYCLVHFSQTFLLFFTY